MVDEIPRPIDESESSLTSDLEFDLPLDIPKNAERIPASEIKAGTESD